MRKNSGTQALAKQTDALNGVPQHGLDVEVSTPPSSLRRQRPPRYKHAHYFRNVVHLNEIDVYRVLMLFDVFDPCIQHAVKKLLVAGRRGPKEMSTDVQEAIDALERWHEMQSENAATAT